MPSSATNILSFLKRRQTFVIIVCMLISSIFWLTIKLSDHNKANCEITIEFKELPVDVFVKEGSLDKLKITIEGTGFSIMEFKSSTKKITIDISKLVPIDKKKMVFDLPLDILSIINQQISDKVKATHVFAHDKNIIFAKREQKKLLVVVNPQIEFKIGYQLIEQIVVPDSIIVYGEKQTLDTMPALFVKGEKYTGINDSFSEKIKLQQTKNISFKEKKINVDYVVARVSEDIVRVPIEVIKSIDTLLEVRIFPTYVDIVCTGDTELLKNISASDFEIVADYKNRNSAKGTIPLEVRKKPNRLKVNIPFSNREVEYLVKRITNK